MTVAELIAELQKADPSAKVHLKIGSPRDEAFTTDVRVEGEKVIGWVSSYDENAWFPGNFCSDADEEEENSKDTELS